MIDCCWLTGGPGSQTSPIHGRQCSMVFVCSEPGGRGGRVKKAGGARGRLRLWQSVGATAAALWLLGQLAALCGGLSV